MADTDNAPQVAVQDDGDLALQAIRQQASSQPQLQAQTPQMDPAGEVDDGDLALAAIRQNMTVKGSGTPQDPYQGIVDFSRKIQEVSGKAQEAYQLGQSEIRDSALGHAVAEGRLTLEEAQRKIDEDEHAKWLSNDVRQYEQNSWGNWAQGLATTAVMGTAESLPSIAQQLTARPESPADLLTGPVTPFLMPAKWTANQVFGQDYLRRRQAGAEHNEAVTFAGANAIGQGIIQALSQVPLGGVAANAAKAPLNTARPIIVKALMGVANHLYTGAKFTVQNEILQGLGQVVQKATDAIEATVSDRPGMMPTVEQAAKEFGENFMRTLGVSAILHTGATGAGVAFRQVAKAFNAAADLHLQAQQAKLDKIAEQQAQTAQALQGHIELDNVQTEAKQPTKVQQERQAVREEYDRAIREREAAEQALARVEKKLAKIEMEKVGAGVPADKEKLKQLRIDREVARQHLKGQVEREGEVAKEVAQIEKQEYKEAKARLEKLTKKIETPKQNGQPNSRLTRGTDVQSVLNQVKEYIENPTNVMKARAFYATAEAEGKITPKIQQDMDIANFVGDVDKATTEELNKLADQIEAVYKEGRASRIQELADAAEARHQWVADVVEGLQGNTLKGYKLQAQIQKLEAAGEPVPQKLRDELKAERAKTEVESGPNPPANPKVHVPFVGRGLQNIFGNWPSLNKTIFRNAINRDELVEKLSTGPILNKIHNAHVENIETLYKHARDLTGLQNAEIRELLRKGSDPLVDRLLGNKGTIKVTIEGKQRKLTINQAMDKLNQWEDPEARDALMEGNAYTPENPFTSSTAEDIREALNKINPVYDKLRLAYKRTYKELYPKLDAEHFEKTGEHLPDNPDYSGPMIHERYSGELTAKDFSTMLEKGSKNKSNSVVTPGATKARTGDTSALAYQDIDAKFKNYSSLTENWIGWRKPIQDVFGPIMDSRTVNKIIINKEGEDLHRAWRDAFEDQIFGLANRKNVLDRLIDRFVLSNIPYSVLANKYFMFPKHVAATFVSTARYVSAADNARLTSEFFSGNFDDVLARYKKIANTPEFKARHGGGEVEMVAGLGLPNKLEHPGLVALQNWTMWPTIMGVKSEAMQYYVLSRSFMEQGMSFPEAMKKADAAINESQVSGRKDMKAAAARGGTFAHVVFAFQSQVVSMANEVAVTWDRFKAMPTAENARTAVKASTAAALSVAIFESTGAAWRYAFATDDKERNDAVLDMVMMPLLSALPLLGFPIIKPVARDAVAGVSNIVAKSQGEQAPYTLLDSSENSMIGTFGKGVHDLWGDAATWAAGEGDALKAMVDINRALSPFVKTPLGSPLNTARKIQKKMEEE